MLIPLQCYRCGTHYEYLGMSPHPARCTACGSSCVPPAGTLTVVNSVHWESANGLSKVWVHATDERDRPFEFEVAAHGTRGKLTAIKVDGTSVDPQLDETFEQLPPAVAAEIERRGVEDVEAAKIENSKR
ncbi:hypothetical protein [Halorientalis regularis]|uniref:Uncharacterized protein n=1 Tax=Halorientalis regularis TaxID=660518 RepID=A0A1G7MUG1_9EURY|nr:hypothetical protein [Halorientalis regularis]SDF65291.1 hypothetical protein SAMN05216218_10866 [Halorientalis regularis]